MSATPLPSELLAAVHRRTREYSLAEIRRSGDYTLASCKWCGCHKSGEADTPNRRQDCCQAVECPCHESQA